MKKLIDIIPTGFQTEWFGNKDISIQGFTMDSRSVKAGDVFIAIKGYSQDGHLYINSAIDKGASVIICSDLPTDTNPSILYGVVKEEVIATFIGELVSNFYAKPSHKVDIIGVTGTNGKTTTTSLLYQLFTHLGYKCGLISTIQIIIDGKIIPATHTTPDVISLHKTLSEMVDVDCDFVFMEISSHAVHQQRIAGVKFEGGVFTNLTHDHLDYHKTFENYRDAKKAFFDNLNPDGFALTNVDDKNGRFMLQNTKSTKYTYGVDNNADFKVKIIDYDLIGMQLDIDDDIIFTTLTGKFNASNLAAVYGTAILLDIPKEDVLQSMTILQSAEGRFNCIRNEEGITGIVDYAHTPDALENILSTIREVLPANQKIISIVGCGGNRDKDKRPMMAKIAINLSHFVILTSDNPRDESPADIIKEMERGIPTYRSKDTLSIVDRREAIKTAKLLAKKGDVILLAGKGHEKYQEIKGVKYPFDDMKTLIEILHS